MVKGYADFNYLLASLKRGDLQAAEYLYRQTRNRLYALANFYLNDVEASRDLVQDFFADFFVNRNFENIDSTVKTYIYNSVRNRALTILRNRTQNNKEKQRFIDDRPAGFENHAVENIEYNLDKEYIRNNIDEGIKRLPPMAEKVFRMHYIECLSHLQIANELGISKHTVANHIQRALKELRVIFKKT